MNFQRFAQLATAPNVLRCLGASVGAATHIHSDICVYNLPSGGCENLRIGSNVYIGPRCVFDLTATIAIDDDASISAQVTFITHLDVGDQPLRRTVPRREGAIQIGRGAWIGVNTTILHGVRVEEFAMIGAMSLVNRTIPARCVAVGIPARVIRRNEPID